jgi:hypothetical protein
MTAHTTLPVDVPIRYATTADIDVIANFAQYHRHSERKGTVTYQHRSGSTLVALYDRDAGLYTSINAASPVGDTSTVDSDGVAVMSFTGSVPLGTVLSALLDAHWVEVIKNASSTVESRRKARVAELEAELARLKAQQS